MSSERTRVKEFLHEFLYSNNQISNQTADCVSDFLIDKNFKIYCGVAAIIHHDIFALNTEIVLDFLRLNEFKFQASKRFNGTRRIAEIYFKDFDVLVKGVIVYECGCCPPKKLKHLSFESY